jgi:hypothetical protein
MTKHFLPDELIFKADYERLDDGATMRWNGVDSFIAQRGSFKAKQENSTAVSEDTGPVMSGTQPLNDEKESPKNVSLQVMQAGLAELFDKRGGDSTIVEKRSDYVRPVFVAPPRDASKRHCIDKFSLWVGSESIDFSLPAGLPINCWRVNGAEDWFAMAFLAALHRLGYLVDESVFEISEASASRERQEQYRIDHPETDSKIFSRKPRNASPTRENDPLRLNAWAEYRRLNGSREPLQTSYGKTDGDNYEYPDGAGVEGGEKPEAKYALDSTFENRPSVEEMEACLANVVTMYPMTFLWHYIIVPVFHNIECIGFRKGIIHDFKPAAIESMGAYARRQAAEPKPHLPRAKCAYDEKQISIVVGRMTKPKQERLNVRDVDMSKPLSICRIGGLHFEPSGKLTHYQDKNGIKHWVKVDVPRKARGPAFLGSANQKDDDDMRRNGWDPRIVAMRSTRMALLSGEEKAENFANEEVAKQWSRAELRIQLRVPLKGESGLCRDLYHRSRRVPPRSSKMARRWLPAPYDTPVRRLLRPVYAFGKTYTLPEEPADDVVERGSTLAAINAMLSPQGLRVANALVHTELTEELAPTREDVGAMFRDGSMDTLRLRGNKAIDDTADELILIFQKLASA